MDASIHTCASRSRCIALTVGMSLSLLGCAEGTTSEQSMRAIADAGPEVGDVPVITQLLPSGNPRGGPLLIRGRNFMRTTAVTIGNLEAEIDALTGTELWVRVPEALPLGSFDVRVFTQRARSEPAPFEVLGNYPPGPPSPPQIVDDTPAASFVIPWLNGVRYVGPGEDAQYFYEWHIACAASEDQDPRLRLLLGSEHSLTAAGFSDVGLYGTWNTITQRISVVVVREDASEAYGGYLTERGYAVLISARSGRQLVIPMGKVCEPCASDDAGACECPERSAPRECRGETLCCSTADFVDHDCLDQVCEAPD